MLTQPNYKCGWGRWQFVRDLETSFLFLAQMMFLYLAIQSGSDMVISFVVLFKTKIRKANLVLVLKRVNGSVIFKLVTPFFGSTSPFRNRSVPFHCSFFLIYFFQRLNKSFYYTTIVHSRFLLKYLSVTSLTNLEHKKHN